MVPAVAARAHMMPVSEEHPLPGCNHFVAAVAMGGSLPGGGHSIEGFYSSHGMALLGTVADGDCGIDVACLMLGLEQTGAQRALLREEPHDRKCGCNYLENTV